MVPEQEAKSIGHEETFASDLWDLGELHRHLVRMVDASATNLRRSGLAARTVTVKIRFADFSLITRAHTLSSPIDATQAVGAVAAALLDSVDLHHGVRLLGVSLSGFGRSDQGVQLTLDLSPSAESAGAPDSGHPEGYPATEGPGRPDGSAGGSTDDDDVERIQQSWGPVTAAVDAIRERYGGSSVGSAALVGAGGLRVRRRGDAQWGPSAPGHDELGGEGPATR